MLFFRFPGSLRAVPLKGARRKRKSVREARRGWPGGEKKAGES